ncbi:MAG: hypothetical protein ABJE10_10650 [bacterium]
MAVLNDNAVDTAMNAVDSPPLTRMEMLMFPAALAYAVATFVFVMAYDQWLAREPRAIVPAVAWSPPL